MTKFVASKFGDGSATGSGNVTTQVHTYYGKRDIGRGQGVYETDGIVNEVSWEITGDDITAATETFPLMSPKLPKGAKATAVYVKVKEAFDLGGTTPTILFGTSGSVATNGFVISEAQAEAVGTYDVTSTLTGTWAAHLAAATTVGVDKGGTSPTAVASVGKLQVVVRYAVI